MKSKIITILLVVICLVCGMKVADAQDPKRFKDQVEILNQMEYDFGDSGKVVLFTGSSSIRMWEDIQQYFPEHNIINNGFGGSQMSDLLYYYEELILSRSPERIFIYEGDNDIASNKRPSGIFRTTKELIGKIRTDLPAAEVILISPKPSIRRWHLTPKYQRLNRKFSRYCDKNSNLEFANVWDVMLDEDGMVYQDIFLEDSLHMNKQGYDLWAELLRDYFK